MPRQKSDTSHTIKKLPACDSCKLRRIRCDPVPPPASCSRCISKDIVCTTTPVVRKKPKERSGKRIEEAKTLYGAANHGASTSTTLQPVRSTAGSPYPLVPAESGMVDLQISGELVAHLLQLYTRLPRARLVPCGFILSAFEDSGRRLSALTPAAQTLTLAVVAMSARISSHPVLFGPGPPPPPLSTFFFRPMSIASDATYQFGKRREAACEKLTDMALEYAWKSKVLSSTSDEAMATCFLLQFLETRRRRRIGNLAHVWKSAFVAQLRQKLARCRNEGFDDFLASQSSTFVLFSSMPSVIGWPPQTSLPPPDPEPFTSQSYTQPHEYSPASAGTTNMWPGTSSDPHHVNLKFEDKPGLQEMELRWCIQLMRDAITSVWRDEICAFTLQDEAMLCGPPPPSLPDLAAYASTSTSPWWDVQGFLDLIRPFTYHITRMALGNYDWRMRRKCGLPFSFTRLREHFEDLKHLHALLAVAQGRYVLAYSPEAAEARARSPRPPRSHSSQFQQPSDPSSGACTPEAFSPPEPEYQDWQLGRLTGRHLLNAMRNALGSVNIPIYEDLQARVEVPASDSLTHDNGVTIGGEFREVFGRTDDPDIPKLAMILRTLRRALIPWGQFMLRNALSGTHLAWLTHLGNEPFLFWCKVLLRATPVEDGGDVLTRAEKLAALSTMSEILVVVSWSWPASFERPIRYELVRAIEDIKLSMALDDRLGSLSQLVTAGLDAYSSSPNHSSSSESPSIHNTTLGSSASSSIFGGGGNYDGCSSSKGREKHSQQFEEHYVLPAVLELPNVEAIMRDAGVMAMIEAAPPAAYVPQATCGYSGGATVSTYVGSSFGQSELGGGDGGGREGGYKDGSETSFSPGATSTSTVPVPAHASVPEATYDESLWFEGESFAPSELAAAFFPPGMQPPSAAMQESTGTGYTASPTYGQHAGGQGWDMMGTGQDFWTVPGSDI